LDAVCLLLSVTVTVTLAVPAAVGVPLMLPPALRFNPAGSAPLLTAQVYPPVPPLAVSVCEYADPTVPAGNDVVVIVSVGAAIAMLSALDAVCLLLSVTVTVTLEVPVAAGVPLMLPPALRLSPAVSVPLLTAQVYPPVPPLPASVCEYAAFTVPPGSEVVVTVRGAGFTVMLNPFDAVEPPWSVTVTVKSDFPAVVGVPAIAPAALTFKPAGNSPAVTLQLFGPLPPLACSVCEYAVPAVPFGSEAVVIVSPGGAAKHRMPSVATPAARKSKKCLMIGS
jgi:hypothetical protein